MASCWAIAFFIEFKVALKLFTSISKSFLTVTKSLSTKTPPIFLKHLQLSEKFDKVFKTRL